MNKKQKQIEDEAYEHMKKNYPDTWSMLQRDWRENSKYAMPAGASTWMEPHRILDPLAARYVHGSTYAHGVPQRIKDEIAQEKAQNKAKELDALRQKEAEQNYEWKQVGYTFVKVKRTQ